MGHTCCPNGHSLWNGDGKTTVFAFRVGFFRDFMKMYPDCILSAEGRFDQLYDCVDACSDEYPGEDLDGWYCDICKGLTIFVDDLHVRYDFVRMDYVPYSSKNKLDQWEDYIALRNDEFDEKFMDHCEGKTPMEAIETYDFQYRYKVSPDKKYIYAIDRNGKIAFGYVQKNLFHLKEG